MYHQCCTSVHACRSSSLASRDQLAFVLLFDLGAAHGRHTRLDVGGQPVAFRRQNHTTQVLLRFPSQRPTIPLQIQVISRSSTEEMASSSSNGTSTIGKTSLEFSVSPASVEMAMVAAPISDQEVVKNQESESSPELRRGHRARASGRSRSPSKEPGVLLAPRQRRRSASGGARRGASEGALVPYVPGVEALVRGSGKTRRNSSSAEVRGRVGRKPAWDATSQATGLPRAPEKLPGHGTPTVHGGWLGEDTKVDHATPTLPLPLQFGEYGPVGRTSARSKRGQPTMSP